MHNPPKLMPTREIASQGNVHANNASKTSRYRPEIDGLRAFAVVAVIINHFNKDLLPGGYLGVDIFFVISGYVITSSLFGRPSKDFKDFISGFYERRIKRLVPALSVFVLITSIAICLFNPSPGSSLETGLNSLFGLSNLFLLKNSTDYFAQSTELNVFAHTWSLGVEEQFYILFPLLIWFSGFGSQAKNGARNLFLIVGTLTIASLIGFLYLYPTNQPAAYFLMTSRFWEMAAGCLIFIGFQKRASIEQFLEKVPPVLVLALIVGVMYLPMSLAAVSTIAVVALSSVLIASLKKQTAAFEAFTHPKVAYIGLISYSLYLWHWGVLSISRWTIGIHWWSVPFQVALMLCLAIASYRWVETPLRKGNWFGNRWKTLMVGGGVLIMVSGGLVALSKPLQGMFYSGRSVKNLSREEYFGKHINKSLISIENCKKQTNDSIKDCIAKPLLTIAPNVLLIGDSHAGHWFPLISKIRQESGIGIYTHIAGWNPPAQPYPPVRYIDNKITKKRWGLVNSFQENMASIFLKNSRPGDVAILASHLSRHFDENSEYFSEDKTYYLRDWEEEVGARAVLELYMNYVSNFVQIAAKRKIRVAIVSPVPSIKIHKLELCHPQWFRPAFAINIDCKTLAFNTKFNNKFHKLARDIQGLSVLEIDNSLNSNLLNNYLDKNHLSEKGALIHENQFSNFISGEE